ncbi:MAG: flagellar filament capping protein FliD, partial [Planctomycetales bacterium]|nr:flagellar filament capping protein FliD [Planctomycetales bacterium]
MPSIDGLATGIDTTSIINSLLSVQQRQIDTLNEQKQQIVAQKTAFGGLEGRLVALQATLRDLTRPDTNAFQRKMITSSDETAVTATVSSDAASGLYSLQVNSLARNHQIATQTYEATDSQVARGDLSIKVGDNDAVTVSISTANNTLEGLVNAINVATKDATASIVNDNGSYRLLLSSNQTGVDNAIDVNFTLADAGEAALAATFDTGNPVQAAEDAEIQVGTGTGAIITHTASNQVDDLFTGVTMDLHKATDGEVIQISVSHDRAAAREAIDNFVEAYNGVVEFAAEQNKFDPNSQTASTLFGNRTLLNVTSKLASTVMQAVNGVADGAPRLLAQLGIRFGANNRLEVRGSAFDDAMNGKFGDKTISTADVAALFGYSGRSDNEYVRFIGASEKTQMSPQRRIDDAVVDVPYRVEVTHAAEQAKLVATNALASSTVIDQNNNTLEISVDDKNSVGLKLRAGTYTQEELADELEFQINNNKDLAGRQVRVAVADQKLTITSVTYGISSEVGELGGTALTDLGLTGTESDRGENVAGRFVFEIDGRTIEEDANGQGRVLAGSGKNQYTAELKVQITLTPDQIPPGGSVDANITVSRGVGESLNDLIDSFMLESSEDTK